MRTPNTPEETIDDQGQVVVPITQQLHFTPFRPDIEVTDDHVSIEDVVVIGERPEATVVAKIATNHGLMEALIRVPRETFNNGALLNQRSANFGPNGTSLVYTKAQQPAITA